MPLGPKPARPLRTILFALALAVLILMIPGPLHAHAVSTGASDSNTHPGGLLLLVNVALLVLITPTRRLCTQNFPVVPSRNR